MKLYIFSTGIMRCKRGLFTPNRHPDQEIEAPVPVFLVQHPRGNVLFDTGCHPEIETNPTKVWGGLIKVFRPELKAEDQIPAQLARIGLKTGDIDFVVLSHLHMDHAGGNQFFAGAEFIVQEEEMAAAKDPANEGKGYYRHDWDYPLCYRLINGEQDLFGDGTIRLKPLPGHSRGMQIVLVKLNETKTFVFAFDGAVNRGNLEDEVIPKMFWDAELTLAGIQEIKRLKQGGAEIIYGHDPEQWAELKLAPLYYE